jgi:hypothetical protein
MAYTNAQFKIENGLLVTGSGSLFEQQVNVGSSDTKANLVVQGDLLYVGGNLHVTGDQIISGTTQYDMDLIPLSTTGRNLGNTTNRWNSFLYEVRVDSYLRPSANAIPLGNTTKRFDTYATDIDASGNVNISNNFTVDGTTLVVDATNNRVGINATPYTATALTVVGNTVVNGNFSVLAGNLTVNGSITTNTTATFGANVVSTGSSLTVGKTNMVTTVTSMTVNTAVTVDQFATSSGKFAKYIITADNSTTATSLVQIVEMLVAHDNNGVVLTTKYGETYNTKLGTIDASVSGSNVVVTFTMGSGGATAANATTVTAVRQQVLS